jgi:hypothetical protein
VLGKEWHVKSEIEAVAETVYPSYVHCILPTIPKHCWHVQEQEGGTCGIVAASNALNLLRHGTAQFDREDLLATAHGWIHRTYGSASFTTEMILKRHGAGTHFGTLRATNAEAVLRALIDQGIPVCLEIDQNTFGPLPIYGLHTIVLVGYSTPYRDAWGNDHEEYYFLNSSYRPNGAWSIESNTVDRDGDGIPEAYPGNHTMERHEFLKRFPTGIYFPVFPSQAAHDQWYRTHMQQRKRWPVLGWLRAQWLSGSFDLARD